MNIIYLGRRRYFWGNTTVLTVLLALGASLLTTWAGSTVATSSNRQAARAAVAIVVQMDATAWEDFSGRLKSMTFSEAATGRPLPSHAIRFREATSFSNGHLLVSIDDALYRVELERADANDDGATTSRKHPNTEFARTK